MSLLGHHLKARRQELQAQHAGYSIRALASRVGIHHSYLSKLERGEHAPLSEERIRALARELGENEDLLLLLGGKVPQRVARLAGKDPKGFLQSLDNLERKESVLPLVAAQGEDQVLEAQELTRRLQDEIRERKDLQQQLAVREREKQTILENLTDAIIEFIDSDFTLLWASPGLQEHLGIAIDKARGRKCFEAIMGRDSPCPWCLAVKVLETGSVQEKTMEQLGQVWKVRSVPVANAAGKVETIVNFGFNVTSLVAAQRALEESERRWKFALEGAQEGVWDWDVAESKVFFSRRWKEMLGYEAGEIGDGLEEWSSRIHPDDYDAVMDAVQRHLQGKTPAYECEHRVRCKDGSYKWILDRGMVVQRGQDGAPLRAIGTHFDITAKKEAEDRLRNSESFLQALLMSIQDGISVLKPDLTVSYVNRTMEDRFGDQGSIVGRKCYEVYRNRSASCEKCPSIRCLELGEAQTEVTLLESGDGERWIELHAYPVRSQENGEIHGVVELVRNVTELHQAKLALEASERRYRELFENAPVGICTVSREGVYVTINPAHAAMYGFASPQDMLQKVPSSQSLFAEPAERERMLELLETRDVVTGYECQMRRKDQSLFWTRRTIRALRDPESGSVSHYEAFVEDIQQQKEAELATRQAQQQLLDVLEQLEAGVYVLNPQDGTVIYANQYLCRAMGLELAGRDARTSLLKKPEDCAFLVEEFVSQPGQVHSLELLFVNERWYLCTGKVMPWFFGKPSGRTSSGTAGRPCAALAVIVVATDISELKKVEEIKHDIDRVMRHDLKSPLNGIIMLPDLLLSMAKRPEDEARMLRAIRDSGKKMLRLIDASLSLYKLETGAYEIMPQEMDMLREVRSAFMEIIEQCQRKDLVLKLQVAGQPATGGVAAPAVCDATITPYLLSNLLKNAAEAAPMGTAIQVDITPGEPLILDIHNQGAVPENVRDSFFEKYATSGKTKGTGLGTYSARLIAQAHGGGVRMQTAAATGTTISVWLPQSQWRSILERKKES